MAMLRLPVRAERCSGRLAAVIDSASSYIKAVLRWREEHHLHPILNANVYIFQHAKRQRNTTIKAGGEYMEML